MTVHNVPEMPTMRTTDIIQSLLKAGFTRQQALGLTTVMLSIKTASVSIDDATRLLADSGFEPAVAETISKTFFETLAAA